MFWHKQLGQENPLIMIDDILEMKAVTLGTGALVCRQTIQKYEHHV